jgi:AraC-like DNA-binding protein
LPLPARDAAAVTGTRIAGDRGTGALVSALARQLPRHLDEIGGRRLGGALLDLLAAAIEAQLDHRSRIAPESRQRALLMRIHAFVEARLGDPDLTPASVAAAHHISVRYLHKLFRAEEATVADHIRRRRLERCSRDLRDPVLRERPVAAIALRWGFVSAAHFNRAFRDAYGLPPGEFRLAHAGPRGRLSPR